MRGMGRVFKRGQIWWVAYCHKGKEYRESSRSRQKDEAQYLLKQRLADPGNIVSKPKAVHYVHELLTLVEKDYVMQQRRSPANHLYLRRLRHEFGHVPIHECTSTFIAQYQRCLHRKGQAPGSINRECTILRRAFTCGRRDGLVVHPPFIQHLAETTVRQGFFDDEEFIALLRYLPPELGDVAQFACLTGWRRGEIVGLEWSNVDRRSRMIHLRPTQTKTNNPRVLAMEGPLAILMERRWQARIVGTRLLPWVFHYYGRRIGNFRRRWEQACEKAELQGKLFHDFRRTAVRNMVRQGLPERVIMSITGHKSRSIFDRYHIVTEADQRAAFQSVFGQLSEAKER